MLRVLLNTESDNSRGKYSWTYSMSIWTEHVRISDYKPRVYLSLFHGGFSLLSRPKISVESQRREKRHVWLIDLCWWGRVHRVR